MRILSALLIISLSSFSALANEEEQLRATVISMAQHFVQEHFMHGDTGHYHIEFDVAYLHPQPNPMFWAVVGGFVSDQNTPNTYVAAVRQVCAESSKVTCWQLEKLAINNKIVLNFSEPL